MQVKIGVAICAVLSAVVSAVVSRGSAHAYRLNLETGELAMIAGVKG